MYLLEYRDEPIDLQYSHGFRLPKNLLFIGTMNTADRSIRAIDIALRRRFEIFECPPDVQILERYYPSLGTNHVPDLLTGFVRLNQQLQERLDKHHTIGHTFFMANEMTPERLRRIWKRQIGPLIEEYFFDQPDVAAEFVPAEFWRV
jgi:5-methylcytosine-specific restriction endonuclease McrBC GTP-binding regulatory subunit McrB